MIPERVIESWKKKYRIQEDGCWIWTACSNGKYPRIGINGKIWYAHRVSFYVKHGRMPNGLAMHTCDVPMCVNPDHISEGTYLDNNRDSIKKGRAAHFERHPMAKLTWDHVNVIRFLRKAHGASTYDLEKLGWCGRATVRQILHGRTWNPKTPSRPDLLVVAGTIEA